MPASRAMLNSRRWYWDPPFAITAVFLMFVVARYMQWGARREIFEKIRIEFLLGIILIGSSVYLLSKIPIHLNQLPEAKKVITAILLLFVAMIVQIPFAADQLLAQTVFWDRVVKFAMLTLFITALIRSPRAMRFFMTAFLAACFYVTQEAARGALNGGLIWENQGIMRLHGAVPIYRHPNSLAGVAAGTIPFCIFLIPVVRSWWVKALLLAPLGTAVICVLYSGSRTGYLGFVAFLLYWWMQSERKGRWLLMAVMFCAVLYPAVPDQYIDRFKSIGNQEAAEGKSKETRIVILEDAVKVFAKNPGGVGVASFPTVRRQMFGRSQDTHNLYLEVATNLGIQGFLVFMFLVTVMLLAFRRALKRFVRFRRMLVKRLRTGDGSRAARNALVSLHEDASYMEAVTKASMGFLIVRLTLGMFGMDLYEVYWWFAAGLAISLVGISRRMGRILARVL